MRNRARGFYLLGRTRADPVAASMGPVRDAGDEDIADPWGRPPSAYAEMFDVIERSIPPLVEHLEWLVSESE